MNDKWIEFAIRIQSIAQAGLTVKSERIIAFQDWRNLLPVPVRIF